MDEVKVIFDKEPANVVVATAKTIPVCIEVCQPICAQSDYTISIEIFDRPVAVIKLSGLTRIFNCDEKK